MLSTNTNIAAYPQTASTIVRNTIQIKTAADIEIAWFVVSGLVQGSLNRALGFWSGPGGSLAWFMVRGSLSGLGGLGLVRG